MACRIASGDRVRRALLLGLGVAALVSTASRTFADPLAAVQAPQELKRLSLEELFDVEVTTVSQKPESLSKTAAAVHVVTQDDIRRMGALSIPEALRNIPGVEVAQVDARQYAITARGFNGTVANKLLVLIDGRSVYTPLFSGVFWDVQDVLMEDVEQVEVIRGPGATVWGANAVNGVINIITRKAAQTRGLLVSGGGGTFEEGFGGARYGGALGSNAAYRIYGKSFRRDDSLRPNGQAAGDGFWVSQGGGRLDWSASADDEFTLQGDVYQGHERQPVGEPVDLGGGNVLVKWMRRITADSDLQLRAYYDRTDRDSPPVFSERLDLYDVEVRHRFTPAAHHDLVWGMGYRRIDDDVRNSPGLAFLPGRVRHDLVSGFVQDEWSMAQDRLRFTLGSKFEHNDYTGFEVQPSGRVAWVPRSDQTLWGAVSRAVRTPSRIDRDLYVPATPPFLLAGGPGFDSEVLRAFELGYKFQPGSTSSASIATFYDSYDRLRSAESGVPMVLANGLEGRAYGIEAELGWQPAEGWRLDTGYSHLQLDLWPGEGSTDVTQVTQEDDSPRHQAFLRVSHSVARTLTLDLTSRYVSRLANQQVPAYVTADANLRWQPDDAVEVGIYGRNLFDPQHPEFGRPATRREVPRSAFGKVTWRF
jgi:iron complex outermembrane recepter protein